MAEEQHAGTSPFTVFISYAQQDCTLPRNPATLPFIPAGSNEFWHQQDQVADEPPNRGKPGKQRRLSQRETPPPKERE